MAVGSISDISSRLRLWLPARWFPTQPVNADGTVPRIYAQLVSWATGLTSVFSQIVYAKAQARIGTSTDGWLDLASQDVYGNTLPRFSGETDQAFAARILANFPPRAGTRPNINAALAVYTGISPRLIEPWRITDTGALDVGTYLDVDTQKNPARLADPSLRYQGFIVTPLPPTPAGPNPVRGIDGVYLDVQNTYGGWLLDLPSSPGQAGLDALIQRLKVEGTIVWVQIGPPSTS